MKDITLKDIREFINLHPAEDSSEFLSKMDIEVMKEGKKRYTSLINQNLKGCFIHFGCINFIYSPYILYYDDNNIMYCLHLINNGFTISKYCIVNFNLSTFQFRL
jgi:hypothetical protein